MRHQVLTLAALMWVGPTAWSVAPVAGAQSPSTAASSRPAAARPTVDYREVVTKYRVTCHNERLKTGGLSLDTVDVSNPAAAADVWERAVRKMRVGMMPPQGAPHPDADTQASLLTYLTTSLDRAALAHCAVVHTHIRICNGAGTWSRVVLAVCGRRRVKRLVAGFGSPTAGVT